MNKDFTLKEAEEAYKYYGCNLYNMYADNPELSEKYEKLNISKEQEKKWIKEEFYSCINKISELEIETEKLWLIHDKATRLAKSIKENDIFETYEIVSRNLLSFIPNDYSVYFAENILDRNDVKFKTSIIFVVDSLENSELANKLVDCADRFISLCKNEALKDRLEITKRLLKRNKGLNKRIFKSLAKSYIIYLQGEPYCSYLGEKRQYVGFFATRKVKAYSKKQAENIAKFQIKKEIKSQSKMLKIQGKEPKLSAKVINEMQNDYEFHHAGFTFYPVENNDI